jgi:hypothetical protein
MRINVPKKIKEDLELIESVLVEMDDSTRSGADVVKVPVSKLHFEKMEFVNIFDQQWQNCSFIQYRLKYLDGREEVIAFENKEKANYEKQVVRASLDTNSFEDASPRAQKNWISSRVGLSYSYAPDSVLNTNLLPEEDLARLTATVDFPETGVLSLKNGLISEKGIVYASSGKTRFLELSRFSSIDELQKYKKEINIFLALSLDNVCRLDNVKYYKGSALNLHTLFGNFNFCHGFLDVAALLNTAYLAELDFQNYDHYVVPENDFNLTKNLFKKLKLDNKKFLYAGQLKIDGEMKSREYSLMFDRLDTPSFDGVCGYYAPGAFDFLRDIYNVGNQHKGRRIYLSREEKNRSVLNEKELLELLDYYDFEIMHGSQQLDMPRIMNEASVVLGAHGSAMANCVFCTKKSILIDLLPQNYAYPYYVGLANSVGFKYHAVISKHVKGDNENKRQIVADVPKIKTLLDEVCYG